MMVEPEDLASAISAIAAVKGIAYDPRFLVQDVASVAAVFSEQDEFAVAIASTVRALELVVAGRASSQSLVDDYEGWQAHHYQHRAAQGERADMRLMFAQVDGIIRVRGFGHRRCPEDFYRRMADIERLDGPPNSGK